MSDSLVLARLFELLGGGVPSTLPQCAGAIFYLGTGFDLGTPQPVSAFLVQLMGDGEHPTGWRVSNRTITIPVVIAAPNRLTLAAARETFFQALTADQFDLVYSPDGTDGTRNTVYECFRAKATTISYSVKQEHMFISQISVQFDAMPYGRSDTLAQLSFDSPVAGANAAIPQVQLDDFSTVSSSTQGTLWAASTATPYGSQSARWAHASSDLLSPLWYTHSITPVNITGCTKLTFWLGLGADSPAAYRAWRKGLVHFAVTLTDNASHTLTMSLQQQCSASESDIWPLWNRVSVSIPQGATFNYASVSSYSIKAWSEVTTRSTGKYQYLEHAGFLAGLLATPTAGPRRPASDRGGDYILYGIEGSAPTQLNLHLQLGFQTLVPSQAKVLLPGQPGTTQSFTAPPENPNWLFGDSVDFEGGSVGTWLNNVNSTLAVSSLQAHGGSNSMSVTPITGGTTCTFVSMSGANVLAQGVPCAAGDRIALRTWVRAGTTARAITLSAEFFNSGGTSIGTQSLSPVTDSSSAWTEINGRVTAPANSAVCRVSVSIPTPATGEVHYFDDNYHSWAVQATVVNTGAGGAGGSTGNIIGSAGGGGGGEIAWETNLDLNPGANHSYTIGKGGVAVKSGGTAPSGQATTFAGGNGLGGAGTTVTANGGTGGQNELSSNYVQGTGGAGGTGSTNTHHFNGGAGGTGTPYNTGDVGGAGGGSAGDGGAGGNASSTTPGVAGAAGSLSVPGRGGGIGSKFSVPPAGGNPGAGGGGTSSYGNGHLGANGGAGQIRLIITTYTATQQFNTALVHKLSDRANIRARAVIGIGDGNDPPDGREYAINPVDGVPARYEGTYTVLLIAQSLNGATARTITVSVNQYEAAGQIETSDSVSESVTPSGVVNGVINLGEITLPIKQMPADNTDSFFTVDVVSGNSADRFLDLLLIDTSGQLFLVNIPGSGYTDYFFDAPSLTQLLGLALGTNTDRSAAVSISGMGAAVPSLITSGGPLTLVPGDNVFTVYSPSGMPGLEGDYWPRWQQERIL